MKQVLVKQGRVIVEDVPAPVGGDREVLVQVYYSCVSTGTEMSSVQESGESLYKRALKKPQNVKKTLEMIKSRGLKKTIARVKSEIDIVKPIGYSASGVVLEVGKEIKDIKKGDRVACAGAGIANHAEFISVPRNLLVKVPHDLSLEISSTVTLGSIAIQGVRRADPKLGEYVAVVGLGILGQMTSQMLKANGCKVIGIDIDQKRVDAALSLGADRGLNPAKENSIDEVVKFSNGFGVDSVIITASTESSEIINQSMEMCRKKGRVIIVGAIGLNLKREKYYEKELDVLISTSYGPGRYDEKYELKGEDYPYAYVRWTENRNMEEYLRLLKDNKINIKLLIERVCPVENVQIAYEELKAGSPKPLIVLLEYNKESIPEKKIVVSTKKIQKDRINIALVGAGSFSKEIHLPNLKKLSDIFNIYAIVNKTGSNAKSIAKEYGAYYATTDFGEVLKDKNVHIVMIATRHNLHAKMAAEAAKAGKAIFLEKPMALNEKELSNLVQILEKTKVPFMVGFNRRFSLFVKRIKEEIKNRQNPMIINYIENSGFMPKNHWVHTEEGGGRNIGEACHIYDLFNFLIENEVESVSASSINPKTEHYASNDNFVTTIKYKDGSVCNLVYTALGTRKVPKEKMEIYVDGKIIRLDDYKNLEIFGSRVERMGTRIQSKGHYEQMVEFAKSIREGDGYPIPIWQLVQATKVSFQVEKKI